MENRTVEQYNEQTAITPVSDEENSYKIISGKQLFAVSESLIVKNIEAYLD